MIVYAVENTVNSKLYIGVTIRDLETRLSQHFKDAKAGSDLYFHRAIRKHGEDAFETTILTRASSKEEMYALEEKYISWFDTFEGRGYNMTPGGEGGYGGPKLTQEDVSEIRTRYASDQGVTQKELAREFGVKPSTISTIVRGVTRTDVGGPIAEKDDPGKLAEAEVVEIRKKHATGNVLQADLAEEYNVSPNTISEIIRGKRFPDAGGPISKTQGIFREKEVIEVREKYATGNVSQPDLAEEHNVTPGTIRKIVRGKTYPDAGGPIAGKRSPERRNNSLVEKEVVEIRKEYTAGNASQADLAEEYNVDQATISYIVRGKTYTDAGGPISEDNGSGGIVNLTEAEVVEIRRKYANGGVTYRDLANEYSAGKSTIGKIVRGRRWPDAGGPIKGEDYS